MEESIYGRLTLRRAGAVECRARTQEVVGSTDLIYLITETMQCLTAERHSLSEDIRAEGLVLAVSKRGGVTG